MAKLLFPSPKDETEEVNDVKTKRNKTTREQRYKGYRETGVTTSTQ